PHDEPEILREIQALSWKQYPTREWDENRWRQYRWAYNRLTEKVDYYIGMLIETLKKAGQLENTVIIFTSDHGDGCGSHRWNQKQILYEEVINVPFIVSLPGRLHARTDDRLVSAGLDILPTLLDFAGTPQPAGMNGRSLRPLLEGQTTTWRDYLVVETEFAEGSKLYGVSGRSVISRSHKYTIYSQGKKREQFFDLAADPGETNDLLNQSSENKQLKQLKKQLATWVETTRDPFVQFLNP
ncbi:MAG TPA: sulfatase-like hydrolase/transferase, partial [Prolixibacteraceae bacterium]|nr:sulfatase-like hydrolase/transferase [Prolixibacteraceae bacterium]